MRMRDKRNQADKRKNEAALKWHERKCDKCTDEKKCPQYEKLRADE